MIVQGVVLRRAACSGWTWLFQHQPAGQCSGRKAWWSWSGLSPNSYPIKQSSLPKGPALRRNCWKHHPNWARHEQQSQREEQVQMKTGEGAEEGGSRKSKVIFSPNLFIETKTYLKIFSKKKPTFLMYQWFKKFHIFFCINNKQIYICFSTHTMYIKALLVWTRSLALTVI